MVTPMCITQRVYNDYSPITFYIYISQCMFNTFKFMKSNLYDSINVIFNFFLELLTTLFTFYFSNQL